MEYFLNAGNFGSVYSVSEKLEKGTFQAILQKITANESVMPGEPAIYRVGIC